MLAVTALSQHRVLSSEFSAAKALFGARSFKTLGHFNKPCDLKPINLAKLKEDDLNKKTALVKHCFNCEHRIDFGNFEILDYNIDYDKRKFLESLYINNTKNSINDKDRNVFPKIYSNIKNLN